MEKLIIGSRGSKLALKYAEIAKKAFLKDLDIEIEIKKITTEGDLVLDRRTSEIGGKGEFIKNLVVQFQIQLQERILIKLTS